MQVQVVLYAIISFVAPPLSKSHMVVYGQQHNSCSHSKNTGGIDLATYKEARGISIHEYTVVDSVFEQRILQLIQPTTCIKQFSIQLYISFHIKDM